MNKLFYQSLESNNKIHILMLYCIMSTFGTFKYIDPNSLVFLHKYDFECRILLKTKCFYPVILHLLK